MQNVPFQILHYQELKIPIQEFIWLPTLHHLAGDQLNDSPSLSLSQARTHIQSVLQLASRASSARSH